MKYLLIFFSISFLGFCSVNSSTEIRSDSKQSNNDLEIKDSLFYILEKIDQAWEVSWERFYHPKTNQFYDYLISYEKGEELNHLPTAEEISRLYPNIQGYDTGMEDCMISAGIMLCMIIDKFEVTRNESLRSSAYEVFKGIKLSSKVHGINGFLARGVCTEDLQSVYIGSSRDQLTHAVYGLWHYYNSSLSSGSIKYEISDILASIADRAIQNVIQSNDYNFLRADGTPDNLLKMWDNDGHEVARLPMIYAAAWDATGEMKYFDQYRKFLNDAIEKSFIDVSKVNSWALLQMQSSFELLISLEKDPELKLNMVKIMQMVSKEGVSRVNNATNNSLKYDLTMLPADWRDGGGIKWDSEYRKMWYSVREVGEASLIQLIDESSSFPNAQKLLLFQGITQLDYNQVSTSGIFYLQGAFWKAKRRGIF